MKNTKTKTLLPLEMVLRIRTEFLQPGAWLQGIPVPTIEPRAFRSWYVSVELSDGIWMSKTISSDVVMQTFLNQVAGDMEVMAFT